MNKSKRVAIIINSLSGGGAEKVMLTLAKTLFFLGHKPHFIVLQQIGEYQVPEYVPLHVCFDSKERNIDSFWKLKTSAETLKKFIKSIEVSNGKFDLYLSNLDKCNLLMVRADVYPLFFVIHNSIEEELKRQRKLGPFAYFNMWRAKKCLSRQQLITVSNGIAEEIKRVSRIKPKSVKTIYNPFEIDKIQEQSKQDNNDIPQGDYLIHVGRVARQKRHDILFAALKLTTTTIPIVLLCSNPKKARKLAKKMGVSERVILPGFQQNPYQWIRRAKALVLSSDYEGLPTVIIEALICGTPVISTDCPHGPNEILTGDMANDLVPTRSAKLLAEKIDLVLCRNNKFKQPQILNEVEAKQVASQYISLI